MMIRTSASVLVSAVAVMGLLADTRAWPHRIPRALLVASDTIPVEFGALQPVVLPPLRTTATFTRPATTGGATAVSQVTNSVTVVQAAGTATSAVATTSGVDITPGPDPVVQQKQQQQQPQQPQPQPQPQLQPTQPQLPSSPTSFLRAEPLGTTSTAPPQPAGWSSLGALAKTLIIGIPLVLLGILCAFVGVCLKHQRKHQNRGGNNNVLRQKNTYHNDDEASKPRIALVDLFGIRTNPTSVEPAAGQQYKTKTKDPVADWIRQQRKGPAVGGFGLWRKGQREVLPTVAEPQPVDSDKQVSELARAAEPPNMSSTSLILEPIMPITPTKTMPRRPPGAKPPCSTPRGSEADSQRARLRKAALDEFTLQQQQSRVPSSAASSSGQSSISAHSNRSRSTTRSNTRGRQLKRTKSTPNLLNAEDDVPLINFLPKHQQARMVAASGIRQDHPARLLNIHTSRSNASATSLASQVSPSGSSSSRSAASSSSSSSSSSKSTGAESLRTKKTIWEQSLFTPGSMLSTAPPLPATPNIVVQPPPPTLLRTPHPPPQPPMSVYSSSSQGSSVSPYYMHHPPPPPIIGGMPYMPHMIPPQQSWLDMYTAPPLYGPAATHYHPAPTRQRSRSRSRTRRDDHGHDSDAASEASRGRKKSSRSRSRSKSRTKRNGSRSRSRARTSKGEEEEKDKENVMNLEFEKLVQNERKN